MSQEKPCSFTELPDLLTVKDVSRITKLTEQTIRTEIHLGHLPGCRIGRRLYVPKKKFMEFVEEGGGINGNHANL